MYPEIEPYESGLLDVGDGQQVHWQTCGNPDGRPALVVHGGPGSGCSPGFARYFDPEVYRVVLFDQRGCGRSTPSAADPATDLTTNTTHHLVADIERLRERLGVERWLLWGGSWGSTLALAYAQRHPERVSALILGPVTTTRPGEIRWLYDGMSRYFPEAWQRFRDAVPADLRGSGLVRAYAGLMADPATFEAAATAWCAWEDAVAGVEPRLPADGEKRSRALAFARLCAHYFSHHAWLEDGELLRNADRLAGIPGLLFHGRRDLGSPLVTAWELAAAWPDAELSVLEDSGHWDDGMRAALVAATDRLAASSSTRA